jgi:hypothetical protein
MRSITSVVVGTVLFGLLVGCAGVNVKHNPPDKITWNPPWPFGSLEFSFAREKERPVASEAELGSKLIPDSGGKYISFSHYQFSINEPPKGCKPFVSAKFKDLDLENREVWKGIQEKVEASKKAYGDIPDDMAVSVALYESHAFRTTCGDEYTGHIDEETKINGWRVNKGGRAAIGKRGQTTVTLRPYIMVIALSKDKLKSREKLKPSVLNLFVAKHRFEITPNYHTVVADPQSKAFVSTYSFDVENLLVKGKLQDFSGAGIFRYYEGRDFLYIVNLYAFQPETTADQWRSYVEYLDTFRYIKPGV